ncbi:alpha/beta fold hydrolase [Micrococcus sp.]|uniref:alpha/beta fold hydrolase n=1 Tax=Micrococcus sp. TaxID=1271 RepID=UPI002A91934E|nr:alpha/beta fold hydrolase [Micrococcus sp.]MDY6055525.1 alpha/beta fold hydrolase [Micrococcus sp.]
MPQIPAAPATLPPADRLPGWDPLWSRLVTIQSAADPAGTTRTLHVADTGPRLAALGAEVVGTIVAVHGNPTWSYLWRSLMELTVRRAEQGLAAWRVVAPDQLDMGFSERLAHPAHPSPSEMGRPGSTYRALGARIDDLDALTAELGLLDLAATGHPVVTLGHDWGGVVSLGWAGRHRDVVAGVSTLNTAVHQPPQARIPAPLQAALAGPVLPASTVATDAFIAVTTSLATPSLAPEVRAAYHLPYGSAERRGGVGGFVADIPVDARHGSHAVLQEVAEGVRALGAQGTPALLQWGADDPVFLDRYLDDLRERLPQARVHRYEEAGHLLVDDRDVATPLYVWLQLLRADLLDDPASGLPGPVPGHGATGHTAVSPSPTTTSAAPVPPVAAVVDPVAPVGTTGAEVDLTAHLGEGTPAPAAAPAVPRLWSHLEDWGAPDSPMREYTALVDMAGAESARTLVGGSRRPVAVTWGELHETVAAMATGLWAAGVRPGDRVSMLVPPGRDLTAALYAVVRVGAVAVVADQGLGIAGMTRAMRSARPRWVLGRTAGLTLARAQSWPGTRISVAPLGSAQRALLGVEDSLYAMVERHRACVADGPVDELGRPLPEPQADADAAVLFTSGSTGPAKGVVYTHERLGHLVRLVGSTLGVGPGSSLLAGFAPFALLGPALGAASVSPVMDVTRPATLTARALADAAIAGQSTVLFASPAALVNVVDTAEGLDADRRAALASISLVLSAGAPVHPLLLRRVRELMPGARIHTPYGMTEGLLLTDIDGDTVQDLRRAEDPGVCVGTPLPGVTLAIAPLAEDGTAEEVLLDASDGHGVLGEFVVSAPHLKDRYDALWFTDHQSKRDGLQLRDGRVWHRTADIGHFDAQGRVWIEGRLQHLITTPQGPLGPGGPEGTVDALGPVRRSAVVGVGPAGTQAVVVVVEPAVPASRPPRRPGHHRDGRPKQGLAPTALASAVRAALEPLPVAAVLVADEIPTDIRHNSKVDRPRVARWAESVLAGGSAAGL